MKILICGANGMVGRNLSANAPMQHQLLLPSKNELNLLNYDETIKYLKINKPELVINAAGIVGGIQANIDKPVEFLIQNTDIGRNIVWASMNVGIKSLINLGSSCIYPTNALSPIKEDKILSGKLEETNEGYALAKIFTLRLCEYINKQYTNFNYKTIIPCNLFGKYDDFDPDRSHMIPAAIRKIHEALLINNNNVKIWGDGNARREFMYCEDLTSMIWRCIDNFNNMPELMNLGLGYDYTINEYYRTIANVIGYKGSFTHDLSKPIGMKRKLVDIEKQTKFGLKPEHSLIEGIIKTYQYFLKNK